MNVRRIVTVAMIVALYVTFAVAMNRPEILPPGTMSKEKLVGLTRYYERKFHTREHEVHFIGVGTTYKPLWAPARACAWSWVRERHLEIYYDLNCTRGMKVGRYVISEAVVARHEVLHEALNQHGLWQNVADQEAEDGVWAWEVEDDRKEAQGR